VTIEQAAAPHSSLAFLFWGAGIFVLPLTLIYTLIVYFVFKGKIDPTVDMKTPPTLQLDKMSAEAFFTDFMEDLKKDPPAIYDQAIVARMKLIGGDSGSTTDPYPTLSDEVRRAR
jgi:hypothetical protein